MRLVTLPRLGTFAAWRDSARAAAAARLPAGAIDWRLEDGAASLFDDGRALPPAPDAGRLTVPKEFPTLARNACAHSDPARFALLYDTLLRLQGRPRLLEDRSDPAVARLGELEKSVRRDMHKMKAFVRFREGPQTGDRRAFCAWFEPDHDIVELVAPFFERRFGDMDWLIVTPRMSVRFCDGALTFHTDPQQRPALEDDTEELWKTYFSNIFNPARLKVKAMTSEMPKKYWRNLPEAALIPEMISTAESRSREMQRAAPSLPPIRARRILDRQAEAAAVAMPAPATGLDGLRRAAAQCTRCPLHCTATQTVFGEGPENARLMIVGEQPGDQEDLAGRPFVGPAGQLFDRLAAEAGLERGTAYVTNAVKHFKFVPRGKRRLHQAPNRQEIDHCKWWLTQEIDLIRPRAILALGATALRALTGDGTAIMKRRGQVETGLHGGPVHIALHPSALLRMRDQAERRMAENTFRHDLKRVAQSLKSVSNSPETAAP